jgi:hypothetical protein
MLIESLTPENIGECLMNVSLALQHAQMERSGTSKLFTLIASGSGIHLLYKAAAIQMKRSAAKPDGNLPNGDRRITPDADADYSLPL